MSEEQVADVSQGEVTQSVDDWRTAIPEDIRDHNSLSHIQDVGALAKSYVHAQSMIGADKVAIPGRYASDDDWSEVYTRLGRPDSAEGYEFDLGGAEIENQEMFDWFRGTAHDIGLNTQQAQRLFNAYNEFADQFEGGTTANAQQMVEQTSFELQREWGQAFDDKLNLANGVVEQFGAEGLTEIQMADGTLLGDNPEVIRMLAEIGTFMTDRIGEDTLEGVRTTGGMTPADAMAAVAEIESNPAYWDAKAPRHEFLVQEAQRLRTLATGE